jgi:hypothetical protein
MVSGRQPSEVRRKADRSRLYSPTFTSTTFWICGSRRKLSRSFLARRIWFATRMTFLGFTIYRAPNLSQTAAKTVFRTEGKRFSRAKTALLEKIRRIRHWPVEKQAAVINATLRGHEMAAHARL